MQGANGLDQAGTGGQGRQEVHGLSTDHLGGFDERAVRELPAAGQSEPMLDQHAEQFGPHFAQDAPGLGAAGLIDLAVLLPEFEEQFELSACPQQDQGLGQ